MGEKVDLALANPDDVQSANALAVVSLKDNSGVAVGTRNTAACAVLAIASKRTAIKAKTLFFNKGTSFLTIYQEFALSDK